MFSQKESKKYFVDEILDVRKDREIRECWLKSALDKVKEEGRQEIRNKVLQEKFNYKEEWNQIK